mgnify:CR=1 FL=1
MVLRSSKQIYTKIKTYTQKYYKTHFFLGFGSYGIVKQGIDLYHLLHLFTARGGQQRINADRIPPPGLASGRSKPPIASAVFGTAPLNQFLIWHLATR